MEQKHAIDAIITPHRRGACPTLDAPMQTGDGLLARVRIAGNRLAPAPLAQLARLAIAHGNGIVEVTARGNLQVRGLSRSSAPLFASGAAKSLTIERGLVIDTSPLSGDDPLEQADPRPLMEAIRSAAAPMADQLGPKVSVVVDGGGQISLAMLKADIRLVARDAERWAVTLGGGKPQIMDAKGAVAATIAVLGALAALGIDARATDLFPAATASPARPSQGGPGWGAAALRTITGHTSPIALPFGQIHGASLIALAEQAQSAGVTTIRLAPGHTLLLDNANPGLISQAASLGYITAPNDPRLNVSACIGSDGCASGHIPARRLAESLAPHVPAGRHLHVSGCAKGCAHPRPAAITLTGRADGIGLVIQGRAGDTPSRILDEAGLIPALARQEDR